VVLPWGLRRGKTGTTNSGEAHEHKCSSRKERAVGMQYPGWATRERESSKKKRPQGLASMLKLSSKRQVKRGLPENIKTADGIAARHGAPSGCW